MNLNRSQIFREASEQKFNYICQTAREKVYYGGTADVLSFDTDIWSIVCRICMEAYWNKSVSRIEGGFTLLTQLIAP